MSQLDGTELAEARLTDEEKITKAKELFPSASGVVGVKEYDRWHAAKHKRVCKSTAKNVYRVTENQLNAMSSELVRNPRYRSAAPMQIFELRDVMDACFKRHGSLEGLESYEQKLKHRRSIRRARPSPEMYELEEDSDDVSSEVSLEGSDIRRGELRRALEEHGLTLREDSVLCNQFVKRGQNGLDFVVEKMAQAKYLHEYCNLGDVARSQFAVNHMLEWSRERRRDALNRDTLRRSIFSTFPPEWPWLLGYEPMAWQEKCELYKPFKGYLNDFTLFSVVTNHDEDRRQTLLRLHECDIPLEHWRRFSCTEDWSGLLTHWKSQHPTPKSLLKRKFSQDEEKCGCGNFPSPHCGCCSRCCEKEACTSKKHRKSRTKRIKVS